MADGARIEGFGLCGDHVGQVGEIPTELFAHDGIAGEHHQRDGEIGQRKNPKRPVHEERAVVIGCVAGIEQDAGDEKPAENEEKLNADPASVQGRDEHVSEAARRDHQIEIVRNNEKNRDRPKAIQGGQTRRRR